MLSSKNIKNILTRVLLLTAILVFITILLGAKFDIVSEGEGVLSINDSNVKILSSSSGIIKEINVSKGDKVTAGEHLLVISNNEDMNKRDLLTYNEAVYEKEIVDLSDDEKILKK
ncbi:hypothetical protein AT251_05580 [Enterovibrio nigricans]|nr:biotin/lipoyl-binding protein [Enterovibrio nigricans]PKF51254.1 hypothetical protein AT251_05580 [Enterovibrio nigricans]